MSSRRPDPVASRHAILAAARGCFSRSGYAGTSMHDIAEAAGVTQSLIHHHFGPKDALWAEVRTFAFGEYVREQKKLIQSGGSEPALLRASMASYFGFLARNPDILRLVAWLELDGPVEFVAEIRDLHAQGVAVLEAGQAAGVLRPDIPARFILTAFIGLVRNWFQERNLVGDESDPERVTALDANYLEAVWTVFSEGLSTSPPDKTTPSVDPQGGPAA